MLSAEAFARNFSPYRTPPVLRRLLELQATSGALSLGFELTDLSDRHLVHSFGDSHVLAAGLRPFARANRSGSQYALWPAVESDPSRMPVVVLGDEGGAHVVAEDVYELLSLLSADLEPDVSWSAVRFPRSSERSSGHLDFVHWLLADGLFIAAPLHIAAAADERYGELFAAWWGQHAGVPRAAVRLTA